MVSLTIYSFTSHNTFDDWLLGPPVTDVSVPSGSVILALFLAGYLGQQYLPPPKPKVIGLDLGTTFCSVGVFLPGSGKVEVIEDEEGRKSIPSAVSFTNTAVLAGYDAVDVADSNPQNTVYDAKRFIGKIFEPGALEQESARYPFQVGQAGDVWGILARWVTAVSHLKMKLSVHWFILCCGYFHN